MKLAEARAIRARQVERWNRQLAQFQTWRPTPTRDECNAVQTGDIGMVKLWDLSEIDPLAFNPFEPPGRPNDGRPVSTAPPVITGLPRVGDQLIATTGDWTPAPTGTYTYQWRRGGYDIQGATQAAYVPTIVDLRWPLRVVVTASNAVGSAAAESAFTAPILPAAPVCIVAPVVTGEPEIGEQLFASVGGWDGTPTAYAYEWRRDLSIIDDETAPLYTPTVEDEGFTLRVGVRGVNTGGAGSITYSTAIGPIGGAAAPGAPPVNLTLPAITGQAAVGAILTSSVGAWANAPTAYVRQWRRDGTDIVGATGVTYTCAAADLGAMISVAVTANNALGSATAVSLEVGPVEDVPVEGAPPVNATPPSLAGLHQVGAVLTVDVGTWTGEPTTYEFEWRRGAEIIAGAVGLTHTVGILDQGWMIYARVIAINAAGLSLPAQTEMTPAVIAAGLPYATTLPVVSGDPRSGEELSTTDGAWTNTPTAFTYEWLRNGLLVSEYEATFDLTDAEVACTIACRVTATNAFGSASFDSAAVGPVIPAGA
jgi:hypothetical protein